MSEGKLQLTPELLRLMKERIDIYYRPKVNNLNNRNNRNNNNKKKNK